MLMEMSPIKSLQIADVVCLETSENYKERFVGEYLTLRIRYEKLRAMVEEWDKGELPFTPTCCRDIYTAQLGWMEKYLMVLEQRAEQEDVDLLAYAYAAMK